MRARDVKLGIVGYGQIARQHLAAFNALGATTVAAVNRSERGRARAREDGVPRTYGGLEEMVDRERPDALLVTASVLSLFDLAVEAIPFGIPILLEKPPGISLSNCRTLAGLAEEHGTAVMVGLNRRFYSVYQRSLAEIGGPTAVTAVSVEWSEDPTKMMALGHPAALLPLLNFANSLHGIDLLSFFAGPILEPMFWGRDLSPRDTTDAFRWQMALEGTAAGGARIRFTSTWDAPGRWRLLVDAEGARMVSAPLETAQILRAGKPSVEVTPSEEDATFKPGFFGQASWFLDVVHGERRVEWPACSLKEASGSMLLAQGLTEACRRSRAEG